MYIIIYPLSVSCIENWCTLELITCNGHNIEAFRIKDWVCIIFFMYPERQIPPESSCYLKSVNDAEKYPMYL